MNERQRQQAIEYMKKLNMDAKYINAFASEGKVYLFGHFLNGIEIDDGSRIFNKIKEIEETRECLIYAVTHEIFSFGECFSFLMVSKYEEDWSLSVRGTGDRHAVLAYVWNVTADWRSESGSVILESANGKIRRIG